MTELTTIIFTLIGVGLALAAINITTFLYLLGRLSAVEKRLLSIKEQVAFIHGLLVRRPGDAVMEQ
ncbi:MAG: hypothetical protein OXI88_02935 [Gammaproteobacteria bacterium]|nr:hypothetical protein [Gammaproteobacteria bacterium]MDE0283805.1 hypothetical protein [Gammaproteobacteria bacterium]MDE0510727.1 hypothetical protein [Gammaproteobacteria bacterium]